MFSLIPRRKDDTVATRREGNPFELIRREFDSLFQRFFSGEGVPDWGETGWGLDLQDAGNEIVVRAEAPGFNAGDFDVQFSGDLLTIQAEHHDEGEGTNGHKHWSRLSRSVTLPTGIDPTKVEARYVNGVLEIHLTRTPEAQPRKIEVKA